MARGDAFMFNNFAGELGDGDYTYGTDTWKLAMIDNTSPPAADDTDTTWATIDDNEVSGTGYTAGGETLTSVSWAWNATTERWELTANDVSWAINASGPTNCYWGIVVNSTTGQCAGAIDMGGPVSMQADAINFEFVDGVVLYHKPNPS